MKGRRILAGGCAARDWNIYARERVELARCSENFEGEKSGERRFGDN